MRNKESGSISWNLAPILVTWLDVWITFFSEIHAVACLCM